MILEHSPAQIVAQYLILQGVVVSPDLTAVWPIYIESQPEKGDCVTIYNTAGIMNGRVMRTGDVSSFPGIQLRVRHASPKTGWAKASEIRSKLDQANRNEVFVDAAIYRLHSINRRTDIVSLGQEEGTGKFLFTINALVTVGRES